MKISRVFVVVSLLMLLFAVSEAQTVDVYGQVRIYEGDPSSGVGVNGVTVHLLDSLMAILYTDVTHTDSVIFSQNPNMTSADGIYLFDDVPYYEYYWVEMEVPEGYIRATLPGQPWWNANPRFCGTDFYNCFLLLIGPGEGHTIGFWGQNCNKAIQGKTKGIQVTAAELTMYLNDIFTQFDGASYFPVENVSSVGGVALTYYDAWDTFTADDNDMINKAKKQLLAVLFDVAAGNNELDGIVSAEGRTLSELIAFTADMINSNGDDLETAKDACDYVNNNMTVPDGWIPTGYEWVVYGELLPGVVQAAATPTTEVLVNTYPNPFNPETSISFDLPENSVISLTVYNLNGQVVTELLDGSFEAGHHSATWKAVDNPSGMYFYRLSSDFGVVSGKMLLLK